jgi:hypothetical protein
MKRALTAPILRGYTRVEIDGMVSYINATTHTTASVTQVLYVGAEIWDYN